MPRAAPAPAGTASVNSEAPTTHYSEAARRALMYAPVVLILTMYGAFQLPTLFAGFEFGHIAGFILYWLLWGITVPLLIVGRRGFADIVLAERRRTISHVFMVLLALPPLVGFLLVFPSLFPSASDRMLLALAGYAVVNATLEEVFWRGLYARVFPDDAMRGVLYPAVGFAMWMLVPMSLYPPWNAVDALSVFTVALSVGLLYGWVAWRTGSIRWTLLSHALTNLAGIGALIIFRP
jgi:hypothetical protein